jgi:hypothetical protein
VDITTLSPAYQERFFKRTDNSTARVVVCYPGVSGPGQGAFVMGRFTKLRIG